MTDKTNIGRKRALELTISDVVAAVEDNARLDAEKAELEVRERRFRTYNEGVIKCTPVSFFVLHHTQLDDAYFVSEDDRDAAYDLCSKLFTCAGIPRALANISKSITRPEFVSDMLQFKNRINLKLQQERVHAMIAHECSVVMRSWCCVYVTLGDKAYRAYALHTSKASDLVAALNDGIKDEYPNVKIESGAAGLITMANPTDVVDLLTHDDKIKGEVARILAKLRAQAQAE